MIAQVMWLVFEVIVEGMKCKERSTRPENKGSYIYNRNAAFGGKSRQMLVMTRGTG